MRLLLATSLVALAACASGGSSLGSSDPGSQSIGSIGSTTRLSMNPGSAPNVNTLTFAPDRVWRILPAAFDSVSVPVTQIDPTQKIMGNAGFKIRQRLGSDRLSKFIDCGKTQIDQNADSYDVYIVLLVQVRPSGTGTAITTSFEASARPLSFSQDYSRCTTNGALEARLLAAIKAQLQ